jgi:hypothetical protein
VRSLDDPQIAWWESKLMFVACDMSGLYRSIDTGGHWTLLDTRVVQGSKRFSVAIHPTERRILGYHPFQGVKESSDGLGWTDFSPSAPLHRQSILDRAGRHHACPPPLGSA